ncbi:hypothetical protein [Paraburkholderia elongata]|uniref:Uncharacterized protein n=1 Tax=Paraburkholderia elongata TaxID=2675747 RepID=A0A972NQI6_9BURK|nr:hypothetical protein [Paraburkholderia elongata]NPT57941.1 hypothetical protein [Paraburkholderia elongata]
MELHGVQQLSENLKAIFSALSDDPSGLVWIIATLNLLTIICGLRENIWRAKAYKVIVLVQLLIVPIVAAMGFHYAIQPPA